VHVRRKAKQALLPLGDEQIAVSRPAVVGDGPRVATRLRGGVCLNKSECEDAGGNWIEEHAGGHCTVGCKDSGTGDWD